MCRVLLGRREVKRPLGRTRFRWAENINIDLQEIRYRAWAGLIWLRIGTSDGHKRGNEPSGSIKCG